MNTSDIIALAKAGFTVEQIAAIAQAPEAPPAPAAQPAAQPAPAQVAQPAPAAQPAALEMPSGWEYGQAILEKLGVLTTAIQQSAIMASNQPKEQTAEDIIAAIIAPPNIKKEE